MGSRGPPNIEGMTSLKVDNISFKTHKEDLEDDFGRYGKVGDVYIPRDRNTNESRGFAFVRFHDKRDAEDAIDAMDGRMVDGREIRVSIAQKPRPTDAGARYSRGGGGGGRRRSRTRSPPRRSRRTRSRSRSRSRSHTPPRQHRRSPSPDKRRRRSPSDGKRRSRSNSR